MGVLRNSAEEVRTVASVVRTVVSVVRTEVSAGHSVASASSAEEVVAHTQGLQVEVRKLARAHGTSVVRGVRIHR